MSITADFEAGTNGNTIATTDAGSATAWNAVNIPTGGSVKYDSAIKAHGSLSGKIICSSTPSAGYFTWSGATWGPQTDHYGRAYVYWPGGNPASVQLLVFFKNAGSGCCRIQVNTSGKFELADDAATVQATSTATVPGSAGWFRIEWHVTHSNSVGQITLRIYKTSMDAPSGSYDEQVQTTANLDILNQSDSMLIGQILNQATTTLQFDDIVGAATTWPGPAGGAVAGYVKPTIIVSREASRRSTRW